MKWEIQLLTHIKNIRNYASNTLEFGKVMLSYVNWSAWEDAGKLNYYFTSR